MSDTAITPALTSLEWTRRQILDGGVVAGEDAVAIIAAAYLTGKYRHALAALCLHGQSFGFSWDDVSDIRFAIGMDWDREDEAVANAMTFRLQSLANRIAALLPPEEGK